MDNTQSKIGPNMKIWLVMALSVFLRLFKLGTRPIWYDEAFSILISKAELPEIATGSLSVHPPTYYFLLHGWMATFGDSVYTARLLSVLFGLMTVWIVYQLGRFVISPEAAWLPALFAAISPFQVHFSQEVRMYSMMTFALTFATYAYFRGWKDGRSYWWWGFSIAAALAQYIQSLSVFYLVPLALIPVLRKDWQLLKKTVLAGLGALLIYLPWLIHLPAQISTTENYWVQTPLASRFLTTLMAFFAGIPLLGLWRWVGFGGAVSVFTFGIVASQRIIRRREGERYLGIWFAYLAIVPVVLLWIFSQYKPVYVERALLTSALMFSVWIGYLVTTKVTPNIERYLFAFLMIVGSGVGVVTHYSFSGFSYADYQGITSYLEDHIASDEVIAHSNKLSFLPTYYYSQDLPQAFVGDAAGSSTDTLQESTKVVLGIRDHASVADAVDGADGVWFLIFKQAITEAEEKFEYTDHPHLEWLDANYMLVDEELWGDLWVIHYRKQTP